jgi:nucleotide-binding universal stress UspA family protein
MRRQPVIVGVDASPAGVLAATTGWAVSFAGDVPCRLVHAIRPPSALAVDPESSALLDGLLAKSRAEIIETIRHHVPPEALDELEIRLGNPTWVLRQAVADASAHLVVLGGKHHAAPIRWFGGSTAHHAVRTIDVPLLVVAAPVTRFMRVLVATDLSDAALPTLEQACEFAALFDAAVKVLTVVEPMPSIPDVGVQIDMSAQLLTAEQETRALVTRLEDGEHMEVSVESGSPARTIADEAAAWDADLVVVGSHGKGWVDRVLLGSTTERLLNRLPCSTLVIPVHGPPAD